MTPLHIMSQVSLGQTEYCLFSFTNGHLRGEKKKKTTTPLENAVGGRLGSSVA